MAGTACRGSVLEAVGIERTAIESGDLEPYLGVLTDDAVFMPPNSHPKEGEELREWLRAFVEGFRVEWLSFVSTEVLESAEAAYHAYAYTWRVHPRAGGEPTTASGKGVHLLRRGSDGTWGIAREIWNASPAGPR